MPLTQYTVTAYHGEHESLFYVVDTLAGDDDQPAVVSTHHSRPEADRRVSQLNGEPDLYTLLYCGPNHAW